MRYIVPCGLAMMACLILTGCAGPAKKPVEAQEGELSEYVDEVNGFSILIPSTWEEPPREQLEAAAKKLPPNVKMLLSIRAPDRWIYMTVIAEKLEKAITANEYCDMIVSNFEKKPARQAKVLGREALTVDGNPAVKYSLSTVNDKGKPIKRVAIVLVRDSTAWSVTVAGNAKFVDQSSDLIEKCLASLIFKKQ